jgi:hypothetical protein
LPATDLTITLRGINNQGAALQGDDLLQTKFRVARLALFGKRRDAGTDLTIALCGILTLRLLLRWQSSPST